MTDKELIKEEIEYRLSSGKYSINSKQALEDIIVFIYSLPEKPASEDLEEAMERSVSEEPILEFFATGQPTIGAYGEDSLRNQFEAGIEWHENQMKEVLQTEYEKGRFDMREEMMKDAVKCDVYYAHMFDENGNPFTDVKFIRRNDNTDYGTKAKIIIVKEEQ